MKARNLFIGLILSLIFPCCTLVKYQTYSQHGVLMGETIVKKSRKVIVRDYNKNTTKFFRANDSTATYNDSIITSKTLYVDSFMYAHTQYNRNNILTYNYKIRRYISCYEAMSSGPAVVVYQLGRICVSDNAGQKLSKYVYRFGWEKDVDYKNGKRTRVKRYRVKKLYEGIE